MPWSGMWKLDYAPLRFAAADKGETGPCKFHHRLIVKKGWCTFRTSLINASIGSIIPACRDVFSAGASYYGIGLKREKVGIGKVLLFNTFCHSILHRLL